MQVMFNHIDLETGETLSYFVQERLKTQRDLRVNYQWLIDWLRRRSGHRKKNGMKEHFDSIYTVEYAMSVWQYAICPICQIDWVSCVFMLYMKKSKSVCLNIYMCENPPEQEHWKKIWLLNVNDKTIFQEKISKVDHDWKEKREESTMIKKMKWRKKKEEICVWNQEKTKKNHSNVETILLVKYGFAYNKWLAMSMRKGYHQQKKN